MAGMGKGPHQPAIRIAEIGNPIYYKTDKRAASASRATKAGREGGARGPRALAEELGSILLFVRSVSQGNLAPRGRGGGQRAVRPVTPRSFSEGARADGRERGAGGGCAVSLYG